MLNKNTPLPRGIGQGVECVIVCVVCVTFFFFFYILLRANKTVQTPDFIS